MAKGQKFVDTAKIFIKAGNGGDGHVGFRREKYVPKGGPNGGDGGRGGDVVAIGSMHMGTLLDFQFQRHFQAKNGEPGGKSQKTGSDGSDMEIRVPLGTVFLDEDGKKTLGEVLADGQRLVLEKGGDGGLGNVHFKSSTNRTPRQFTPGIKTEGKWIRLELRIVADVGIVGKPNAGKSTLLSTITAARPKIGDYPFTTLHPGLGVIQQDGHSITLADMPGLIENAHQGAGLGIQFLRHIQRTRALLYLTAADPNDPESAWRDYQATRREIAEFDNALSEKPAVVAINKADLLQATEIIQDIEAPFLKNGVKPILISAKTRSGLDRLKEACFEKISQ